MAQISLTQSDAVFGFAGYLVSLGYIVAKEGETLTPIQLASQYAKAFCKFNNIGSPTKGYEKRVIIPLGNPTADKSDAAPIFNDAEFQGE